MTGRAAHGNGPWRPCAWVALLQLGLVRFAPQHAAKTRWSAQATFCRRLAFGPACVRPGFLATLSRLPGLRVFSGSPAEREPPGAGPRPLPARSNVWWYQHGRDPLRPFFRVRRIRIAGDRNPTPGNGNGTSSEPHPQKHKCEQRPTNKDKIPKQKAYPTPAIPRPRPDSCRLTGLYHLGSVKRPHVNK